MRTLRFEYLTIGEILRVVGRAEGEAFRVHCDCLPDGWLVIQVANATLGEFCLQLWTYRFVVLMVAMVFSILVAMVACAFELTIKVSGPLSWRSKGSLMGGRLRS